MSIFSKIASAEHTFAAWAEKQIAKLLGEAPTFLQIADITLSYAGPVLQTVLAGVGQTALADEAGTVIKQALSDITVVQAVIHDAGAVPTAASMLAAIQADLAEVLAAGHISDPVSAALVTKVLKEFAALLAAFPAPAPVAVAA